MENEEFQIGLEFWMSGKQYRCTDVGTRGIAAICISDYPSGDPDGWTVGPPYAICETFLDENDLDACSLENDNPIQATKTSRLSNLLHKFLGLFRFPYPK